MNADTMKEQLARQIMWNRLIAVVEEGAQVLLKTAFGAITREAGDLSAGVYDTRGRMLAQAVTGTPGHVNTMAVAVTHFLDRYPIAAMRPGDVYITNDPWMGTGHLFDFVVVTPAFHRDRLVGFFAATCHVIDIGGRGFTAEARSVYEEGLMIPHLPLFTAGKPNEQLFAIIAANVRDPLQVRGDLLSLCASNEAGVKRLTGMMDEFGIDSIDPLGEYIIETSRQGMIDAIAQLPRGRYTSSMTLDGYDEPVRLEVAITIDGSGLTVDYAGSSPTARFGINSPKCYTDAYTVFGVKCAIAPDVPNNAGSLDVVKVLAPDDTIVNPLRPAPVTARHVTGQTLPEAVFGALSTPMQGRVPAEGAGSIWVMPLVSGHETSQMDAKHRATATRFSAMSVAVGGVGGRPGKDGLSSVAFPSGVGSIPVEITEAACPLLFTRRELRADSAGAGEYRGGLAPTVELVNLEPVPFTISAGTFDRRANPARGRNGGGEGALGNARLASGAVFAGKSVYTVPSGDRLILDLPGGAGYGDPLKRDPVRVAEEVADGLLSVANARDDYGVAVDAAGRLDLAQTEALRRARAGAGRRSG